MAVFTSVKDSFPEALAVSIAAWIASSLFHLQPGWPAGRRHCNSLITFCEGAHTISS